MTQFKGARLPFAILGGFLISLSACNSFRADDTQLIEASSVSAELETEEDLVLKKTDGRVLYKEDPIFSSASSVVMTLDKNTQGLLFQMSSATNTEQSSVVVEGNSLKITNVLTSGHSTQVELSIALQQRLVLAIGFNEDPAKMTVMINGRIKTINVQTQGSPYPFSYLMKQKPFIDKRILSAHVFTRELNSLELGALSYVSGAKYQISDVVYNPTAVPAQKAPVNSSLQLKVAEIIRVNCTSCHNNATIRDFRNITADKLLQMGLLVKGQPDNSKIYYRLRNSLSDNGPKNMPQSTALATGDIDTIRAWILGL